MGSEARDAVEGQGPQRRLGRRLEEVAEAVGGGYCRLPMPLKLALGVRETVAGCRLGALEGGGGTGLRERGKDTSRSTGRSGRQNAATQRNMRRGDRVTVQGPVKEQQPDGMSHGGGYLPPFQCIPVSGRKKVCAPKIAPSCRPL